MKLKKIKIENIKSFKNETIIDFDDETILIGPNSSGKSNLFDIITIVLRRFLILPVEVSDQTQGEITSEAIGRPSAFEPIHSFLEKHNARTQDDSRIEITISPTDEDFSNISVLLENMSILDEQSKKYMNFPWPHFKNYNWISEEIKYPNQIYDPERYKKLVYVIKNGSLQSPPQGTYEYQFLYYLNNLDLFIEVAKNVENIVFSPPYIYFPPYRATAVKNLSISLSEAKFSQLRARYFNSTSKTLTSLIDLGTHYFALKLREYGDRKLDFEKDNEVRSFTKILAKLGYNWTLECTNKSKNIYEILLSKNNEHLKLSQASSGEKEIINFVLGLFALNVRGGLILIDEPELHLHPKWQKIFWEIINETCRENGTQVIATTHSASFISKDTLEKLIVFRKENDHTRVTKIEKDELPDVRTLLHLINTHNNERIFFADKVVLLEGVTDRLVFETVLDIAKETKKTDRVIEIVEVRGKGNFEAYKKLLAAIAVPTFLIADLDYLKDIDGSQSGHLFVTNANQIIKRVVTAKKSKDLKSLLDALEQGIAQKDLMQLEEVWAHIKARCKALRPNLNATEKTLLSQRVLHFKNMNVFILEEGEIEDYLPKTLRSLDQLLSGKISGRLSQWILSNSSEAINLRNIGNIITYS